MASKWDDLDASTQIEQAVTEDLRTAFETRGATVTHNGTATRHAPGGRPDIVVSADDRSLDLVVELTKSTGAAAEREFVSTTDHLNRWAEASKAAQTHMIFSAPKIGPRLRKQFLQFNRDQRTNGQPTRVFVVDFGGLQTLLETMSARDPKLVPVSRWAELFEDEAWEAAADDASARQVAIDLILAEETELRQEVEKETQQEIAQIEQDLKKAIAKLEDALRDRGITGDNANKTLIYLTFMRLFEEKRLREKDGDPYNRMTAGGFQKWVQSRDASVKKQKENRLVNYLLEVIREERDDLSQARLLLAADGSSVELHHNVTDSLVESLIFPVLDQYEFIGSRLDILGVVFETLARRGEKDTRIGQFFTPEEVVKFAVRVARPSASEVVLDPAVGTGRFLIWAMQAMLEQKSLPGQDPAEVERRIKSEQLLGSDIDTWVATIAKMNMFIHGDGKTNIANANGLVLGDRAHLTRYPDGIAGQVDLVLSNPPLGDVDFTSAAADWLRDAESGATATSGEYLASLGVVPTFVSEEQAAERLRADIEALRAEAEGHERDLDEGTHTSKTRRALTSLRKRIKARETRLNELTTKIANGDITITASGAKMKGGALFMGAITNYLRPVSSARSSDPYEWRGGRVMVVLDEAILNTPAHSATRQYIRENYFVKAVVSLGRPAFKYLAHTDAKTSLLYAIRKPDGAGIQQQEQVFYAHAEKVGYDAKGNWIGSDLPAVADAFTAFETATMNAYGGATFAAADAANAYAQIESHDRSWYTAPVGGPGDRLDFYNARRSVLEAQLHDQGLPICTLGDLIEVAPVKHPHASRTGSYSFASIERNTASLKSKGSAVTQYKPGDLWVLEAGQIVVSGIDVVHGAVAVTDEGVEGCVMSKEMYAYRMRDGVDIRPETVVMLLRSASARAMIEGMVTGTSNRTRMSDVAQILDLLIPDPRQFDASDETVEALGRAHRLRDEAHMALRQAEALADSAWGSAAIATDDAADQLELEADHTGPVGSVPPTP